MSDYPYAERFGVNRRLPEQGRTRADVLAELREMAAEEDAFWETGKCSGTMYSGDHDHYRFLTEAFGMFAHTNVLQRDMCPSATKFEGEIIAMALDLMHADAVSGGTPAGMVTNGGSASILHAVLAHREHARQRRGVDRPNFVKPETGHPAFDKACRLLGVELRAVPVDPATMRADVEAMAKEVDDATIAIMGSATNYGYGIIDPIAELAAVAAERGVGMHVDACLGGYILPFGEELGYPIPPFDFRVPGVTTISADTHKYGYSVKGTSTLLFCDKAVRNAQYFALSGWSGGKYMSPGIEGSRSGGLLAATWAAMVQLGREGYRAHARQIFETSRAMQEVVRTHPELRIIGEPTFCFAFTSDEFAIYLLDDAMRARGWRFNGLQYPDAIHMAVTRPQTRPGVVDAFARDLDAAIAYAKEKQAAGEQAFSGAIYGGVPGGLTPEADELIMTVMADMLDTQQSVPKA
ncbi:MAG TPA: aspartate aminotransferase family protein [Marmoricola sp.]|nr:aspartate aminotransferase family protein [Marmoricola sp.]